MKFSRNVIFQTYNSIRDKLTWSFWLHSIIPIITIQLDGFWIRNHFIFPGAILFISILYPWECLEVQRRSFISQSILLNWPSSFSCSFLVPHVIDTHIRAVTTFSTFFLKRVIKPVESSLHGRKLLATQTRADGKMFRFWTSLQSITWIFLMRSSQWGL